jgi:hypothetical protein
MRAFATSSIEAAQAHRLYRDFMHSHELGKEFAARVVGMDVTNAGAINISID